MDIKALHSRQESLTDDKTVKTYTQFAALLTELRKRNLPDHIVHAVNQSIDKINASTFTDHQLRKLVKKEQTSMLKQLEKELKIVPINYYRTLWLVVGMSAFGLPFGVSFGMALGNMGFIGLGLPIGMAIGQSVGANMDKKAKDEGRQLNIELKN